ncbi:MAG: hypothetical protein DRG69_01560 [Deltaproteobacteria bacterium]|nr:MAG: hypothetical protein DRG69_01560 [Deltaproteobacteria bacterium]
MNGLPDGVYDIVWPREDNSKTRWHQCGVLVIKDGRANIKLNLIPTANWDGWLKVFPKKGQEGVPF